METAEIERLAALEDDHWWFRERRAVLARLLKQLGPPGTAVDIGAACGGNTRVLRDSGWSVTALDASAVGTQICHQRGVAAIRGDATQLPLADRSLDLVVAYDVLEHIENDAEVVREARRVLRPGGTFLVAVPADPSMWSAHDVALDHVRRYTSESLSSVISGNGFHIADMWNWNVLMKPAMKLHRRRTTGSDMDDVSATVNALLMGIIRLERYLPVSKLPGISLFVRAQASLSKSA